MVKIAIACLFFWLYLETYDCAAHTVCMYTTHDKIESDVFSACDVQNNERKTKRDQ